MFPKSLLVMLALLGPAAEAGAETLLAITVNAIRDENGDGVPDLLTPQSSNYVFNSHNVEQAHRPSESRTFVEFALPKDLVPFDHATLSFTVFRYNSPNVPPQRLSLYWYQGDGVVQLEDWSKPATPLATTTPIEGPPVSSRGEALQLECDVTAALHKATDAGARYLSLSVLNLARTAVNSRDRLGSSAAVSVGNFQINTYTGPDEFATATPSARPRRPGKAEIQQQLVATMDTRPGKRAPLARAFTVITALPPAFAARYPQLRPIAQPLPEYPLARRAAGQPGMATVHFTVAEDGTVAQLSSRPLDSVFDAAARNAVEKWVFAPYETGEKRVAIELDYQFFFLMAED